MGVRLTVGNSPTVAVALRPTTPACAVGSPSPKTQATTHSAGSWAAHPQRQENAHSLIAPRVTPPIATLLQPMTPPLAPSSCRRAPASAECSQTNTPSGQTTAAAVATGTVAATATSVAREEATKIPHI